jgi:hypothetical protein
VIGKVVARREGSWLKGGRDPAAEILGEDASLAENARRARLHAAVMTQAAHRHGRRPRTDRGEIHGASR